MLRFVGRAGFGSLAALAVLAGSPAVSAQDSEQLRIQKLEAEVRALQRKVFPGGAGRYFEPEIGNSQSVQVPIPGSTNAVTDILVRLDALETQLQRLTSQTEENTNGLGLLTARLTALESPSTGAVAVPQTAPQSTTQDPVVAATQPIPASSSENLAAMTGGASRPATAAATPVTTGPTSARLAAVSQIAKPATGDAADDEYSYGFRLWEAGFYPEAQQQLRLFLDKYPSHWRTTYGRNLLGRAYLDDGKARDAAPWFLQNYQSDKTGARAGDSLLFLAQTMIELKDTSRACIALSEFGETYPALASGRLASSYQANIGKVSCN
ncbi:hypothetical protein [Altererythrobacter aquiaggeris]|uniref:tetratricopeptide repeat protein n=1 Tax=Aestuarierythrobacter aquiaggeris TaxID=1898396 RepID=UPI0030165138